MPGANSPLAEPPEGAISGDSIPRENEADDYEETAIQKLVGILKTKDAYHGMPDDELREIAKEKFAEVR